MMRRQDSNLNLSLPSLFYPVMPDAGFPELNYGDHDQLVSHSPWIPGSSLRICRSFVNIA